MSARQRGFTMIEVMIAGAILATLLSISISVMMAMADSSASVKGETYAAQIAGRAVEDIVTLVRQAKHPPSLSPDTKDYRFQVPVDADPATPGVQLIGPTAQPVYGADGVDGQYYAIKFVPNGREVNETELGVSINADGDTTDVYEVGHIEFGICASETAPPSTAVAMTPEIVLRYSAGGGTGEVVETTDTEDLITSDATTELDVTVMAADFSTKIPALYRARARVRLPNAQHSE